jgi:hypothetical protein
VLLSDSARPAQEPGGCRPYQRGTVPTQERRATTRALRGISRWPCRAGPAGARGQGRAVRQPAEQPARSWPATARAVRRPGGARRAGPWLSGRHGHGSGWGWQDLCPRRTWPRARARVPGWCDAPSERRTSG